MLDDSLDESLDDSLDDSSLVTLDDGKTTKSKYSKVSILLEEKKRLL